MQRNVHGNATRQLKHRHSKDAIAAAAGGRKHHQASSGQICTATNSGSSSGSSPLLEVASGSTARFPRQTLYQSQSQRQKPQTPNRPDQQLSSDNLREFKERVDSTIQQLSGLVSLLSGRDQEAAAEATENRMRCQGGGGGGGVSRMNADRQRSIAGSVTNSSNRGDAALCSRCLAPDKASAKPSIKSTSALPPPPPQPPRQKRPPMQKQQQQPQHQQQTQKLQSAITFSPQPSVRREQDKPAEGGSGNKLGDQDDGIRFLWFDAVKRRYSSRSVELVCAKPVRRLHVSVHYFRVAGEDLLLLEKNCTDDGLAFLDADSVVAFEGLSVERVQRLQRLGCQLKPEDLTRDFAVEKAGRTFYLVPVEDTGDGDWQVCRDGVSRLETLKRMLEQQEIRRGAGQGARPT